MIRVTVTVQRFQSRLQAGNVTQFVPDDEVAPEVTTHEYPNFAEVPDVLRDIEDDLEDSKILTGVDDGEF